MSISVRVWVRGNERGCGVRAGRALSLWYGGWTETTLTKVPNQSPSGVTRTFTSSPISSFAFSSVLLMASHVTNTLSTTSGSFSITSVRRDVTIVCIRCVLGVMYACKSDRGGGGVCVHIFGRHAPYLLLSYHTPPCLHLYPQTRFGRQS